ncbi:uncharacterized protein TNCV_367431 [Trichonephila clavipes]|nr:uncharacterized protein TNCV_367431 [Trichonephila clavipes]
MSRQCDSPESIAWRIIRKPPDGAESTSKDESVREGYIRNGGKEVKLFTRALKIFQCNNRIVMAQRKHLDDFLRGRIIGRLEYVDISSWMYPKNLESPRVSSLGFGNDSKMMVM